MNLILSSENVLEYLVSVNLCEPLDKKQVNIEQKVAKNFNLLLQFPDQTQVLVKQERFDLLGKTGGVFFKEWRIQELLKTYSDLKHLLPLLSQGLHFDPTHSIIVFNYLDDYWDLSEFYTKESNFVPTIADAIGTSLAKIHCSTFNNTDYRKFLSELDADTSRVKTPKPNFGIDRVGPEIFGSVPADGIKFFSLYQRYDSLGKAISELTSAYMPCCLTHNDLKLNNILLSQAWERELPLSKQSNEIIVRLIDWERGSWGDPAFDLGMVIASYLQFWLSSLVVSKSIDIQESLRLAMTPLEQIQPSIAAFLTGYLSHFPEIIESYPDFLKRVVQSAGLALVQQIQATIQYQKSFSNTGICMLQVAKSLLCRPEQSIPTVFGTSASEILTLDLLHL